MKEINSIAQILDPIWIQLYAQLSDKVGVEALGVMVNTDNVFQPMLDPIRNSIVIQILRKIDNKSYVK